MANYSSQKAYGVADVSTGERGFDSIFVSDPASIGKVITVLALHLHSV
jgi:hypothetical protein